MYRYCYIVVINVSDVRVSDLVPVETIQKKKQKKKKRVAFNKADGYSFAGNVFFVFKPTLLIKFAV